jgi:hypothetical protein
MDNLKIDPDSKIDENYDDTRNKKSNYSYFVETLLTKNITTADILKNNANMYGQGILHILCYHVTQNSKYPFIQFLLEKLPYCNDIIQEKLVLPMITISKENTNNNLESEEDYSISIIDKIKGLLPALGCDGSKLTSDSFKGLLSDQNERIYALVDISAVDIFRIAITRNTPIWFALPTEIMNVRSICNIPIDESISELFLNMPELGVLRKLDIENMFPVGDAFPLPDAIYNGSYLRQTEFRSVFGTSKEKIYASCGEYYYYFRLFEDAIKEGGWLRDGGHKLIDLTDTNITHSVSGTKLVDNEYGRYIQGGINRYAFFPGNYMLHTESSNMFSLTDTEVCTKLERNDCIVIHYMEDTLDNILPDILVKEYGLAFPISYHMLNKSILGDKYEIDKQDKYMIA